MAALATVTLTPTQASSRRSYVIAEDEIDEFAKIEEAHRRLNKAEKKRLKRQRRNLRNAGMLDCETDLEIMDEVDVTECEEIGDENE